MSNINSKGRFITVEGIEGVGKSTAVTFLQQWFKEQGIAHIATREPGGTAVAEQIRQVLLKQQQEPIYAETELLLLFAGRTQHLRQVILPALQAGQWVLCDRFTDASYAYQGGGRGIPDPVIAALEQQVQQGLQPDLTILLDAPYETSVRRISERGEKDRIEQEQAEFFEKVREKYQQRAQQFSERYRLVNADQSLPQVQQELMQVMERFLKDFG